MSDTTPAKPQLDWKNIIFLALTPIGAITSLIYFYTHGGVPLLTWLLALLLAIAAGMSITTGYHRCFAHATFQAHWFVRFVLLCFGAAAFENSAKFWCADHRLHHQHTDHERDPYNITKGFWHAHIGWIFYKTPVTPTSFDHIADLLADPLVRWQDRYFTPIAVATGMILPTLIAWSWGDPWGGFWIAGITRIVLNQHFTFAINSFCHWIGSQPYSEKYTARDSWLLAFFTFGEGYHNFHHAFPGDYRNGVRGWHFDPAKWLIFCLGKIGLASKLQRIPEERVLFARLRMQEQRAVARLAARPHLFLQPEFLSAGRKQVEQAHAYLTGLRQQYRQLRKEKLQQWQEQAAQLRNQMQQARSDFRIALQQWSLTIKCAQA